MLEIEGAGAASTPVPTLIERVAASLRAFGCERVRVHGAGRHVLLGFEGQDAFARLTAMGSGTYGLAFRGGMERTWEILLVDELPAAVEHALVGGDALD